MPSAGQGWAAGSGPSAAAAGLRSLTARFLCALDPPTASPAPGQLSAFPGAHSLRKNVKFSWYQQENRKRLGRGGCVRQWFKEAQLWINSPGCPLDSMDLNTSSGMRVLCREINNLEMKPAGSRCQRAGGAGRGPPAAPMQGLLLAPPPAAADRCTAPRSSARTGRSVRGGPCQACPLCCPGRGSA